MKTIGKGLALLMLGNATSALAADDPAFTLGEVLVMGSTETQQADTVSIDLDALRLHDRETVGAALNMAPGVSLSHIGARNEQMVYVRGFDLRQVPVFIDGIPVYVPYDGYVDLGRFNTFDLARIDVAKGFSSLMYGPNALGGAINLVSRRAAQGFSGDFGGGSSLDDDGSSSGSRSYGNLAYGTNAWYVQASASLLESDGFPLSDDFTPTAVEDGGLRDGSDARDQKFSLKFALTPNDSDEYALRYVRQDGEKGNPSYAGTVPGIRARYWDWPYWNKESLYFLSTTTLGMHTLKTRVYADTYGNGLYSWDDASHASMNRPYAFRSFYDDDTQGASLELASRFSDDNLLRTTLQWKQDTHREHDVGDPWQKYEDNTASIAVENTRRLRDDLTLVAGLGWNKREGKAAEDYNPATGITTEFQHASNDGLSAQAGLFWSASESTRVHASIARKNRFATVKDRYSYRMGTAIPNPGLKTEQALHYELGLSHDLGTHWQLTTAVFYSDIEDLIQSVTIAPTACTSSPCSQLQNVGEARSQGMEFGIEGSLEQLSLGANYTWLDRDNLSNPGVRLTDTPDHTAFAWSSWQFTPQFGLTLSAEGASSRINSTDGAQRSAGYATVNLKAVYAFASGLSVEAGIHNLADRNYQISEGFPEAGRSALVQFHYPFGR